MGFDPAIGNHKRFPTRHQTHVMRPDAAGREFAQARKCFGVPDAYDTFSGLVIVFSGKENRAIG